MLGDVSPFPVEVGKPAGDLGRGRGLFEAVALRCDLAPSRFEKSPKKPGAMEIFFRGLLKKRKIRGEEERGCTGGSLGGDGPWHALAATSTRP